jgi:hypothetical protein
MRIMSIREILKSSMGYLQVKEVPMDLIEMVGVNK